MHSLSCFKSKSNHRHIRSVPRDFSRKKGRRSNLNKSMINPDNNASDNQGVILAMSRRNKLKNSRNFRSGKTNSKFRLPEHHQSRRSNSVSTHRTRRSNSSKRSSSYKSKMYQRFYKSNWGLKAHKYIKNVLPIVSANNTRGAIANNFDSPQHFNQQL